MLVVGYSSCVIGYIVLSLDLDCFELLAEMSCYILVTVVVSVGVYRVSVELLSRSSFTSRTRSCCYLYLVFLFLVCSCSS
jgi:hypothetical protein